MDCEEKQVMFMVYPFLLEAEVTKKTMASAPRLLLEAVSQAKWTTVISQVLQVELFLLILTLQSVVTITYAMLLKTARHTLYKFVSSYMGPDYEGKKHSHTVVDHVPTLTVHSQEES